MGGKKWDLARGVEELYEKLISPARKKVEELPHPLRLVDHYQIRCGVVGFVAGLGGGILMPVAISANLYLLLRHKLEMCIGLAILGGYDPHHWETKLKIFSILAGEEVENWEEEKGKILLNLGKGSLKHTLIKKGTSKALLKIGGKRALGRMVPLVGGVVGGVWDTHSCRKSGKKALQLFWDRERWGELPPNWTPVSPKMERGVGKFTGKLLPKLRRGENWKKGEKLEIGKI
jgi:hypothetical protein